MVVEMAAGCVFEKIAKLLDLCFKKLERVSVDWLRTHSYHD